MCFSQIGIFDTENTEAPPSPESRLRAIDGGGTSPDYKPSGLNRRRPTAVTLRVFRSRRRHGNSSYRRKTRSYARLLEDKSLDGNLRIRPEVDQETKPASGDAEIIEKLRSVNIRSRGADLELYDDLSETEKSG